MVIFAIVSNRSKTQAKVKLNQVKRVNKTTVMKISTNSNFGDWLELFHVSKDDLNSRSIE